MRLFIAGLAHESNRLSPVPTDLSSYEEAGIARGGAQPISAEPMLRGMGLPQLIEDYGLEAELGLFTYAQPGGITIAADYELLRDELIGRLVQCAPVDLIFLFLHGAMMAQGYDDCEADILERVRAVVGPDVPIGVVFDCHANVTAEMVSSGALLVGCKTYPHVDFDSCAAQLLDLMVRTRKGEIRPVTAHVSVPMIGFFPTTPEPMHSLVEKVREMEGHGGVLSVTLCHGFPWSDWSGAGSAILVVTDDDPPLAERLATEIADRFFSAYPAINAPPMLSAREAVARARSAAARPVVIADASDNPGGGAASDSTQLIQELLAFPGEEAAVGLVYDPLATAMAHQLGPGARWKMRIGGKFGPYSGQPLDLNVEVGACLEGVCQRGFNAEIRLQRTACVRAGKLSIILSELRCQTFDPICFEAHGVELARQQIIVVKSSQHFRDLFEVVAAEILFADTGGALSFDFAKQPFSGLRRPILPLDQPPFRRDAHVWTLERR